MLGRRRSSAGRAKTHHVQLTAGRGIEVQYPCLGGLDGEGMRLHPRNVQKGSGLRAHRSTVDVKDDHSLEDNEILDGQWMPMRRRSQAATHHLFDKAETAVGLGRGSVKQPQCLDQPHGRRGLSVQHIGRGVP